MTFDPKQLAYCGIYCEQCSFKVAAEERDRKHLEPIPGRYDHMKTVDFSELACEGCKGANICGECDKKDCASAKGFTSCADCGDFPCPSIDAFANDGAPHHAWAVENLRRIRELGTEGWYAELAKELSCPHCGERQSWYWRCDCGAYNQFSLKNKIDR